MNILMVSPGFPPMIGGGEQYARQLALALLARGHRITVLSSDAAREADFWRGSGGRQTQVAQEDGLTVVRCPARGLPGGRLTLLGWRKAMVVLSRIGLRERPLARMAHCIPRIGGLREALREQRPDLVHAFNLSWEGPLLAAHELARRRDVPLVITPFTHLGKGPGDRVALNSTMTHQLAALRAADAVLSLTSVEAEQLATLGVSPERIHTVGGGLRTPPPPPDADARRRLLERLGITPPFALFIGRVTRDKGAILSMAAIERLRAEGVALELALIGAISPEAQRAHDRLRPEARSAVHLLGPLDEAGKQALLAEATLLLLPSQVESFGIVLLEAWHHGLPVIAARAGGLPGVVREGVNGLLVPPRDVVALANAVRELLMQPEWARALGRNGQEGLVDYAWPAVAAHVEAAYRAALAHRGLDAAR